MRMSHARLSTALLLASAVGLSSPAFAQSGVAYTQRSWSNVAVVVAPAAPILVNAVSPATPALRAMPVAVPAGPLAAQPRGVALSRQHAVVDSMTPPAPSDNDRGNTALMLAGGAAMIVGAVVGDDAGTLIIVGGAIIGFYGLYRFITN